MYSWKGLAVSSSPSERLGQVCLELVEALASADSAAVAALLAEQARLTEVLVSQPDPDPQEIGRVREHLLWLQGCVRPMLSALGLNDPKNTYGPRRRGAAPTSEGLLVRASR